MFAPAGRSARSMSAGRSSSLERPRPSTHDAPLAQSGRSGVLAQRWRLFCHRSEDGEPNSIQSSEPSKQLDAPRLSGGSSDRDNANKNKNEKDSGWGGES